MKFGSVYDPFNAETLSPQVYYIFGSPSLSSDRLVLPNNTGVLSGVRMWGLHDLTGTEIRVRTAVPMPTGTHSPDPANQSFFQLIYGKVSAVDGNFHGNLCLEWLKEGNLVYARWAANYNELGTTITWNTLAGFPAAYVADHTYLRFRCATDPQVAFWESSPDGSDWRATAGLGGSADVGVDLDAMSLRLMAQSYTTEPPAAWQIDQIGITPPGGKPVLGTPTIEISSSTARVAA